MRRETKILSREDRQRIEQAIADAEKMTAGEIVVLAVRASGEYGWARWAWAFVGWIVATAVLWFLSRHWLFPFTLPEIFLLQLFGASAASCLGFWAPTLRLVLPPAWAARECHRAAFANFTAVGLHETRDRTGVLVYLSEVERRVEILADSGIHAQAGDGYWSEQMSTIVRAIHDGKPADGVCRAVAEIGKKLAAHFPPRADDTDEVSNAVRVGDQIPEK